MKKRFLTALSLLAASASAPALDYNQTITAIFGSGNPDTGWTTGAGGGIELGLRAKNRDDGSTPNVDGVYSFATGYSVNNPARALWNFEFSINVGAQMFSMYDFYLAIDTDAGAGVNYVSSLINPLTALDDNSFGRFVPSHLATGNGLGVEVSLASALVEGYTVAQNSLNIAFLGGNPDAAGIYDYRLFAVSKLNPDDVNNSPLPSSGGNTFIDSLPSATQSAPIADVNIQVRVGNPASVPDAGSSLAFLSLSLAGLAGLRRRFAA